MVFKTTRKGKDKRIPGVVIIGLKRYAIKLIIFPKEGITVEVMHTYYKVNKVKFHEAKHGIVPIIYLTKTAKQPKQLKKK